MLFNMDSFNYDKQPETEFPPGTYFYVMNGDDMPTEEHSFFKNCKVIAGWPNPVLEYARVRGYFGQESLRTIDELATSIYRPSFNMGIYRNPSGLVVPVAIYGPVEGTDHHTVRLGGFWQKMSQVSMDNRGMAVMLH